MREAGRGDKDTWWLSFGLKKGKSFSEELREKPKPGSSRIDGVLFVGDLRVDVLVVYNQYPGAPARHALQYFEY